MSHHLRRRYGHTAGERFRVAYLGAGARRVLVSGEFLLETAKSLMRRFKRQGLTTWVETTDGQFFPVEGARKQPRYLP